MSTTRLQPRPRTAASPSLDERSRLERRARRLAWGGNAWHVIEFAIAVGAGVAAGSIALVAFGVDSLIEVAAGLTIIWRFSGSRRGSATSERRAQQIIAFSYFLLAAYVAVESVRDLAGGNEPGVSLGRHRARRGHGADDAGARPC